MCDFCKNYDFTRVKAEVNGKKANISLALCNTKFSEEEQFKFCPVCGENLNNLVKEMVGEG